MGRYRRSSRHASMKARLSIAAAVLVGGGAIGAVAVAASNHSAPSTAQSAGFYWNTPRHHQMSVGNALNTALTSWNSSQSTAMTALTQMAPMRTFATAQMRHTTLAAQRGVVVLATKHWLLVKSANGSLHLWLINGATKVKNVVGNTTGTTAMTGSTNAATAAATRGNMTPATQTMAGTTTQAVTSMTAPVAKPTTITVSVPGTNEVITITISQSTAAVTPSGTSAAVTTSTPMTTTVQPVMAVTNHIARGDLVFVAGVEKHHQLVAQLVLFTPPATTTPTPTATPTIPTATPTVPSTATPTTGATQTTPVATSSTFSGVRS
jgi:hypothetical protein